MPLNNDQIYCMQIANTDCIKPPFYNISTLIKMSIDVCDMCHDKLTLLLSFRNPERYCKLHKTKYVITIL